MALAGGFIKGDRVQVGHRGEAGTVEGRPARAAANSVSVSVRFDDGRHHDERIAQLELLVEPETMDFRDREGGVAAAAPSFDKSMKAEELSNSSQIRRQFIKLLDAQSPEPSPAPQVEAAAASTAIPANPFESPAKAAFFPNTVQMRDVLHMNSTLVDKMRQYATPGGWKMLRPEVEPVFDELSTHRGERTQDYLTYPQTMKFFSVIGQSFFGQDLSYLLDRDKFDRFNFDGDEGLQFLEAFRCLRLCLTEKFDAAGVVPHTNEVTMQTPPQAGYQKIRELARGGQGAAWLATRMSDGSQVALKVYKKGDPNALDIADLVAELEIAKKLDSSPYIMHSYEIFQDRQNLYAVNELLPGGDFESLRKKCATAGVALTEDYFKNLFRQCLKGLSHIHMRCIMHCDIKEPNIMLKTTNIAEPHIAFIDLGMARVAAGAGLAGGTPGYRPPETNANNIWYPRGDIFSLGVTFFQLLANKVPDAHTGQLGIFQEGARSVEDCVRFVASRPVPVRMISKYPGTHSWLPQMMNKQRKNRLVAVQILALPFFKEDDDKQHTQTEDFADPTDTAGIALNEDGRSAWATPSPQKRGSRDDGAASPQQMRQGRTVRLPQGGYPAKGAASPTAKVPAKTATMREPLVSTDAPAAPYDRASPEPPRLVFDAPEPSMLPSPERPGVARPALVAGHADPRLVKSVKNAMEKLKSCVLVRHRSIRHAWLAFDKAHTGKLSSEGFGNGLLLHGIILSPPEVDIAFSMVDKDGTGDISYKNFCAAMS